MDSGLSISEEHERNECDDSEGHFLQVNKDLEASDLESFAVCFDGYLNDVEGVYLTPDALVERAIRYVQAFEIKVAVVDGRVVAFIAYERLFCILGIRAMYSLSDFREKGVVKALIEEFHDPLIVFRTLNARPPHRLFKLTRDKRTLLHQDTTHTLWLYRWRE